MTPRKAFVIVVAVAAALFVLRASMIGSALGQDRETCSAAGGAARICTVASEARYGREAESLIAVSVVGLVVVGVAYLFIARHGRRTVSTDV